VLGRVSRTPGGYHSIAAVQLVLLAGILFAVLKECGVTWRALLVAAVIVTPSVVIPFTGLIYPERNVLFWLAILVLCLQRARSSRTSLYFIGCFVATHFLLYYKEPLVVLVAGYAVSRILMDFFSNRSVGRVSWREFAEKNLIPLGMMMVAGIYSMVFLVFMFPFNRAGYIHESGLCHHEKPYACRHADEASEGGLLILLPTDVVQQSDLAQAEKSGVPLVSVAAWPEESTLGHGLRLLQVLSLKGGKHVLSQPWWQLHIFKKPMSTAATGPVEPADLHPVMERIPAANLSER
jgi:hypothetical protein